MNGVAIDTSNGLVYVAGTSKSTLELFENYAKTAFGGEMKRMSPSTLSASDSEHPLEDLMSNIYAESMTLSLNGKTYSIAEQGKATLSRTDGPSVSVTDAPNSAKSYLTGSEASSVRSEAVISSTAFQSFCFRTSSPSARPIWPVCTSSGR